MSLFDESLRKIDNLFRITGMHLNNREDINMKKSRIIYYINFIFYTTDMIFVYYFFLNQIYSGKNLTVLIYAFPCLTMGTLGYAKSIPSIINHEHIDQIMFLLRDLETKSNLKNHVDKNIQQSINFLHLVIKVQNYCNWATIITFPLMPVTLSAYTYFTTNEIVLLLPFYARYPIDAYNIKYWPFVVLKQVWTGK